MLTMRQQTLGYHLGNANISRWNRNHPHGPVAERLWGYIEIEAPGLKALAGNGVGK